MKQNSTITANNLWDLTILWSNQVRHQIAVYKRLSPRTKDPEVDNIVLSLYKGMGSVK